MRTRTNLAIDAVMLVLYVTAASPTVTGISLHEWLGAGFGVFGLVHLVRHREWVLGSARRLFGSIARRSRIDLVADALLLLTSAGVVITGLAISRTLLPLAGIAGLSGASAVVWSRLHAISAYGLLATALFHVVHHRKWIASAWRLHVLAPLDAAFEGRVRPGLATNAVAWGVPVALALTTVCLALGMIGGATTAGANLYASAVTGSGSATFTSSSAFAGSDTAGRVSGAGSSTTLTCPRTGCTASYCHATGGGGR